MICLDEAGRNVIRPALLWNDTRSAPEAEALVSELGADAWARAVGSVPLAAFTVSKLRWLAEHEPDNADRTAAVCLPHDWLTWRFLCSQHQDGLTIESLTTDRSDASGTGYWSAITDEYRFDLLQRALGRVVKVPRVLGPSESPGQSGCARLGPGAGDNASAALVVGPTDGDVVVSVGTSGTAFGSSGILIPDSSGDGRRLCRREQGATYRSFVPSTLPVFSRGLPGSLVSINKVFPTWHRRLPQEPMDEFSSPTLKENELPISRTQPASCTVSASRRPLRNTSPGRRLKACCAAWRTWLMPSGHMASRSSVCT